MHLCCVVKEQRHVEVDFHSLVKTKHQGQAFPFTSLPCAQTSASQSTFVDDTGCSSGLFSPRAPLMSSSSNGCSDSDCTVAIFTYFSLFSTPKNMEANDDDWKRVLRHLRPQRLHLKRHLSINVDGLDLHYRITHNI